MRETKSEDIQAKRGRLAGQRHTVTSLGSLRYRFNAHPPAHSVGGAPRRSGFSLRSLPSVRMLDRSRPAEARACLRTRHAPKRKSQPDTGAPISSHGAALQRAPCGRVSPVSSFRPGGPPSASAETVKLNASVFARPFGSAVSRRLDACRVKTGAASFRTPLLPKPARHPLREGQSGRDAPSRVRTQACAYA